MSDTPKTFSQKLQRLEEIVRQLERPDVELEDGLQLLEEGVALHQECQKLLGQTQAKITKLLEGTTGANETEDVQARQSAKQVSDMTEGTLFEAVAESVQSDDEDLPF